MTLWAATSIGIVGMVSDGPEKERLEQKVIDSGMENMIIFTGNLARMR